MKLSNLTVKHKKNYKWPVEKRIQAVTLYLSLGNMALVAAATGIGHDLLRQWKAQPWWKEYEAQIRNTENLQLDSKLTKIVERSLEAVADRLDNGEVILNQKTGELLRKPVSMKDAARVSTDLLTKRELLRGNATSRSEDVQQISVADQLKNLAIEFAKWSKNPPKETIDVTDVEVIHHGEDEGDKEGEVAEDDNDSGDIHDSDDGGGLETVDEAVHVWQLLCEYMQEENPGKEAEAYTIEHIAKILYTQYLKLGDKNALHEKRSGKGMYQMQDIPAVGKLQSEKSDG